MSTEHPYQALNDAMAFYVPELKSRYGQYPMNHGAQWLSAKCTHPDGKPAFLAAGAPPNQNEEKDLIDDYVWGPGTLGFGYYHLTTKESYKILAARLRELSAPNLAGVFSKAKRQRKEQLKQIEIILYYRSASPVPQDAHARTHGLQTNAAAFRPPDDLPFWQYRLK